MLVTKLFQKGGSKPIGKALTEQIKILSIGCVCTIIYSKISFESNENVFHSLKS